MHQKMARKVQPHLSKLRGYISVLNREDTSRASPPEAAWVSPNVTHHPRGEQRSINLAAHRGKIPQPEKLASKTSRVNSEAFLMLDLCKKSP